MTAPTMGPATIEPALALGIGLVVLDVDGVMTDGGVYLGSGQHDGTIELKRFHIRDGLGIKLLMRAGLEVAIVSGRVSAATALRARELGIEACHQDGAAEKLPVVLNMAAARGLDLAHVAMLADDLADLPVLRRIGLPAAVADAAGEVRQAARWVGARAGGTGAVREFAEALLQARGVWADLVEDYCAERSRV